MEIDEINRQILQLLGEDPRISSAKISEIVGLTPQAVGVRIKKLREAGIIGGIKILKPIPKLSKEIKKIERFKTNITGLDQHLGGGFPSPSTNLLIGESGVGTSVFSLKILWSALNESMKCAYFAIERPSEQVIQQMRSFGWDPSQSERVKFIDVYDIIESHIREFESVSHINILQIYREMIERQKELMPDTEMMLFDSFTELIKLAKGSPIESALINQLGTNIIKHKSDVICFYVLKPHFISNNALLTLKSYSDCVLQFRKELKNQQIQRYLLIEKMLFTDHTTSEIKFHVTNQGIILNDFLLQTQALQNPVSGKNAALFRLEELDYLTQGLTYGTAWLLEIDSLFPLNDLVKIYVNFFIDGLARQRICRFAFPKVSLSNLIDIFKQSIENNKVLKKSNISFEDIIAREQLTLYDFFQKSRLRDEKVDPEHFESVSWSHNPEKNLAQLGTLFTNPGSKSTYYGLILSDLIEIPLTEKQIIWLYNYFLDIIQKHGDVLLTTIFPAFHQPNFINKLEYYSDGIIKLWVDSSNPGGQNKYIQIIKNPQGRPSASHLLQLTIKPPYFQII